MPRKAALAILSFAVLVTAMQAPFVPARFRFAPVQYRKLLDFEPRELLLHPPVYEIVEPVYRPRAMSRNAVPGLSDATGSLRHFYSALWRTEQRTPGAVTRVLHYGDSPTTADSVTADIRSLLQQQFGNAGHGFVLIAKPWAWYGHRGVDLRASGWHIEAATMGRAADGFHGLGGVSFTGETGASSTVTLPAGHTRMELQYLEQPGGGTLRLTAGDEEIGAVDTGGDAKRPRFAEFPLPPGANAVMLRVVAGKARVFGWSFEKNRPGVVYSSLGLNGGQVEAVLWYFEPKQWTAELRHADPDLVVLNYGTNESVYPAYVDKTYEHELRALVDRVRTALPTASVLIMSPMDRGARDSSGDIVTPPVFARLIAIQRKVAADTGCAFFNTFEMMGGAATMAKWYSVQPRLVSADFMHPLPAGAAIVGRLVEEALMKGYAGYKAANGAADSPVAATVPPVAKKKSAR
jgi:lysophospholipase L1-like esterase